MNTKINNAKINKKDEFYTLYKDIQKEIEQYIKNNEYVFEDKIIYLPCDDYKKSNFVKYFIDNAKKLNFKKMIATSYNKDKKGSLFILQKECLNENIAYIQVISELKGNGDFRNNENIIIKREADIIITNPPFSLFRNFFNWIIEDNKQFLIIGNINCITYKEIFEEIKEKNIWLGTGLGRWISGFTVPEEYKLYGTEVNADKTIISTNNCLWLTNLEHNKRHMFLELHTMEENLTRNKSLMKKLKKVYGYTEYPIYDNYEAIEVPFVNAIPSDYDGVMGVPITFLDKYNPEQFEIIKFRKGNDNKDLKINGKSPYFRILIKKQKKI